LVIKLNMAQTLDGHTYREESGWATTSSEDRRRMDRLRKWAQVVIVSRRSAEKDNPNLFVRNQPDSLHHPIPVVILSDGSQKISGDLRIFNSPHPPGEFWIQTNVPASIDSLIQNPSDKAMRWKIFQFNSVADIIDHHRKNNFSRILLEGGPTLNHFFLEEELINEVYTTIVPSLWSGLTSDRIVSGNSFLNTVALKLVSSERRGHELFLRYKVRYIP